MNIGHSTAVDIRKYCEYRGIILTSSTTQCTRKVKHCAPGLPLTASEDSSVRRGLVSRITVSCPRGWFQHATDPYNADHLSVNMRAVLAMRMIGRGSSSLETVAVKELL